MLNEFRNKIDKCDLEIINLIKKRLNICREIGIHKKKNNLPIYNPEREKLLLDKLKKFADDSIDKDNIEEIYKVIFKISKNLQEKL